MVGRESSMVCKSIKLNHKLSERKIKWRAIIIRLANEKKIFPNSFWYF